MIEWDHQKSRLEQNSGGLLVISSDTRLANDRHTEEGAATNAKSFENPLYPCCGYILPVNNAQEIIWALMSTNTGAKAAHFSEHRKYEHQFEQHAAYASAD